MPAGVLTLRWPAVPQALAGWGFAVFPAIDRPKNSNRRKEENLADRIIAITL
jgi:hypothetical protein